MSIQKAVQALEQDINKIVSTFVENISDKYNLDKDELFSLFGDLKISSKPVKAKPTLDSVDMDDLSFERLSSCSKAELSALCKHHGHFCTGKKELLIDRLMGKSDSKPEKKEKKEGKASAKAKIRATESISVIKKLTSDVPVIPIRRNAYGNLEHPETRLVFDRKSEKAVGTQADDGTVTDLTDEDIQNCKKFKFQYNLPKNLDKGSTAREDEDNEALPGVDSDEDEIVESEEEEDEIVDSDEEL